MISKELLSVIFNKNVTEIEYCETCKSTILDLVIPGSLVFRTNDNQYGMWRNIHDVANECKEWAESKGYYIMSGTWALQDGKQKACIIGKPKPLETFVADTEYEAIFKACEWILNHKGVLCLQL